MNMFRKILKYPRLTQAYPKKPLPVSDRFVGKPAIDPRQCTRCGICAAHCPSRAIDLVPDRPIGINLD